MQLSMPSYLYPGHFDLVTPDGSIHSLTKKADRTLLATLRIEDISPAFVGFSIPQACIQFNFKSLLAQLELDGIMTELALDQKKRTAELKVEIQALGPVGQEMLPLIHVGAYIGKLFAADERRRVRNPSDYLSRMFGRTDQMGRPLLSLGSREGRERLILERIKGQMVAFLALRGGRYLYQPSVRGFLPTCAKALLLKSPGFHLRDLLRLHQQWQPNVPRTLNDNEVLLAATPPLHIRTVFARVVSSLLPAGFNHTHANVLQPDTMASGDIYEFYGKSSNEIYDVPLEFFTLEPHREHVFFQDRDQLQQRLEDPDAIFEVFKTAPKPADHPAAVFVVKGTQMVGLEEKEWIITNPTLKPFPGVMQVKRQALMAENYIDEQPSTPFMRAIEDGLITSQGVLFTRYFPSPLTKRMLLSYHVQRCLKGIYFQTPSRSGKHYFSQEDRAMLIDLVQAGIPVFWADLTTNQVLQYVQRPEKASGMFVPIDRIDTFLNATFFGIYGSNLLEGNFEQELQKLLEGVLEMRNEVHHPLLKPDTPLALVTGGGPGAMEVGNRMAQSLKILSCANVVNFSRDGQEFVNEQKQNPYIEAKMTYRLDHLVERQAEFYLDLPIFVMGGIGTDFEYALEEVRHKVGASPGSPILLFGSPSYWEAKVSSRFGINKKTGTIKGSEWVSNCFFCIETAEQGLEIYRHFFDKTLLIGKEGPVYSKGFVPPGELQVQKA